MEDAPLSTAELAALAQWREASPAEVALRLKPAADLRPAVVATQLELCKHFARKLPRWTAGGCLLQRTACEQATAEAVAALRFAGMQGALALDVTGGMGVDAAQLARQFSEVIYVEADAQRCAWAQWNFRQLGLTNIRVVQATAEDFLAAYSGARPDFCYADPDRRPGGSRQIRLEGLMPQPAFLAAAFLKLAPRAALKLSPMLDATDACRKLPGIVQVEALGAEGECKELLLWLAPGADSPAATRRARGLWQEQVYTIPGSCSVLPAATSENTCLYEPDAAIAKLRLLPEAAVQYLGEAHSLTHPDGYAQSALYQPAWPGRIWQVLGSFPFGKSLLRQYLQQQGLKAVQLTARHFPIPAAELRKLVGNQPDGPDFLLFTRHADGRRQVYHVRRA
ncbi:MAG: hypothetical protein KF690_03435 [Bacteroidetes bacterium]|nr:hypothetical protein [Bacteroidota bacterium]